MKNIHFLFLFSLLFGVFQIQTSSAQVSIADYNALVALYNSTNGNSWTNNTNWNTSQTPASNTVDNSWHGVTVVGGRVTQLNLTNNNLVGSIPTQIGDLTALQVLRLNTIAAANPNQISGTLPTQIGNLTNLIELVLSFNQITGNIPTSIGNLTNLTELDLYGNLLSGSIPTQIGTMTSLQRFIVGDNNLTGTVPSQINNLSNLTRIELQDNNLTGVIPLLNNLSNLEGLFLSSNQFTNYPNLSNSTGLNRLDVGNNNLQFAPLEATRTNPNPATFNYSPQAIYQVPQDTYNNNVGESITMDGTITGANNQYQWYKGATPIGGATSATYTIPSLVVGDAGTYTCRVTNTLVTGLTIISEDITVSVTAAPTIALGTINPTTYCAGETISVPFNTTGSFNGGNTFTAQLSNAAGNFGTPIATQTGTSPITLTIPAGATTATAYRVRVVSSNPSVNSNQSVALTINALPLDRTIVANPATIISGNTTNIEVPNSETGVSYQLQDVSNGNANVGSPVTGNGGTIQLLTQTLTTSNDFRVVATRSGCTRTFNTITVTVNAPTITLGTINPTTYCAGETISVPFNTTGSFNGGNTFTAQLSNAAGNFGTPIATQTGTSPIILTIPAGATTATAYRVRVVSSNPSVNSNQSASLTINTRPTINLSVSSNSGTEAAATSITVTATASQAVSGDQSVNLVVSGTDITTGDYTISNSTITILNGQTTGAVTFTVVDDALIEGTETAILTISSPSSCATLGVSTTQSIVITDNDFAPCAITAISAGTQTNCIGGDPINGTYEYAQDITVTYSNPPASGDLVVNGQSFSIGTSPQTVTLTGLTPDGNSVDVIAVFSADASCTFTETNAFTALDAVRITNVVVTDATCNTNSGGISLDVSGGTPPYSFLWNTGATTQNITNSVAGNYTLWVTDASGNGCTASINRNINSSTDNTDPTITAPSNVTVNTDAGLCTASGVTLGTPTGSDNCGTPTFTNDAPATFPIGVTTVTWTATDGNSNIATAIQTVTVTGAREIGVLGNAVSIIDGDVTPSLADDTDFGNTAIARTITYTIENTGIEDLDISSITSNNTTDFTVSSVPTTVTAGGTATFDVNFTATSTGTSTATITINNNDCDEAIYDFVVQGENTSSGDILLVETGINYPSIQAAIDAAVAGQTIQPTSARLYDENVVVDKNLTFTSPTAFTDYTDINIDGIKVNTGISLIIDGYMSINKVLEMEGTAQMTVNTGQNFALRSTTDETALLINGSTTNTIVGTVIMERYLPAVSDVGGTDGLGYHLFSSPFSNATVSQFGDDMGLVLTTAYNTAPEPAFVRPFPTFFHYDETNGRANTSAYYNDFISNYKVPTTPNLEVAKGYQANIATGTTIDLNGTLNNGDISLAVTNSSGNAADGYNLVGNPYPSPIDWDNVHAASIGVENALYLEIPTSQYDGRFAEYVAGTGVVNNGGKKEIASMQGFFVRTVAGGTVNMNNTVRLDTDTRFYKTTETQNTKEGLVRVALQGNNTLDETTIYFQNGATANFDGKYDAAKIHKFNSKLSTLYSYNEDAEDTEYFAINGLGSFKENQTLPLAMNILKGGDYEITLRSMKYFHSKHELYLYDSLTDSLHNLKAEGDYKFEAKKGYEIKRFVLLFKTDASQDFFENEKLMVYPNPTSNSFSYSLKTNREGTYTIRLFDATGRAIFESEQSKEGAFLEGTVDLEKHASGLYLLQVSDADKTMTVRIVKE
ncbi:choice-of-anchor D domain-containing protein [Bernardetia sp. ABR2-2B]|uniref:choice-of-anchor D domain-containing protein n=1 Tax=Bernardetia sp. ABR2-2B TaxID=3127472 RepID=UPI0030CAC4C0